MNINDIIKEIENYNSLSLSYIDNNSPKSCSLWFASNYENNYLSIFFLSSETSNHGSTISNEASVAFTIAKDEQEYFQIRGIQGSGICQKLSGERSNKGWNIYMDKFQFLSDMKLQKAIKSSKIWEIKINWIRLIDNNIRFGHKSERFFDIK